MLATDLNIDSILKCAKDSGVEAIHPGYVRPLPSLGRAQRPLLACHAARKR
jgi:hypothetical protein